MARGDVVIKIVGDASQFKSAMGETETTLQKVSGKMMNVGAKMSLAVTAPLALLGKGAGNAASDLEESLSKVGVVFGEQAPIIEEFAETSAKSLGISKQAALEAAGTFGNLFSALGLSQEAAADMSPELVTLAGDLASFNNADPSEMLEKLRAGLVGEVEPLRTVGVNLNAAMVEAKAMEMGLVDVNGEVTEAGKVQARFALILEQTKTAQGDFARTSDGVANSQRIAKAEADNAAASLGQGLLPITQKVTEWAGKLGAAFAGLSSEWQTTILVGAAVLAAIGPLATVIGGITAAVGALGTALAFLAANPVVLIIAAIAALAVGLVIAYQKSETFRNIVDGAMRVVAGAVNWVRENFDKLLIAMGPVGVAVFLLKEHFTTAWAAIRSAVQLAWGSISIALNAMKSAIDKVAGPLKSVLDTAGKVGGAVGGAVGAAGGLLGKIPGFDSGGIVPGALGSPQLILAHGGETVLPTHKTGMGGGGGITVQINGPIYGFPDFERAVHDAVVQGSNRAGGWAMRLRPAS